MPLNMVEIRRALASSRAALEEADRLATIAAANNRELWPDEIQEEIEGTIVLLEKVDRMFEEGDARLLADIDRAGRTVAGS